MIRGSYPFRRGDRLTLGLPDDQQLEVGVDDVFDPSTMSIVLRVTIESQPVPTLAVIKVDVVVLKLYHRPFATGLRESAAAAPYTEILENEHIEDPLRNPPRSDDNKDSEVSNFRRPI